MKVYVILAVTVILSGCEISAGVSGSSVEIGRAGGTIEMIKLEDGTRCVTYSGYNSGGIDCDWGGKGAGQ